MEWVETAKSYAELGFLGISACMLVTMAWLYFKGYREKESKANDKLEARLDTKDTNLERRYDTKDANLERRFDSLLDMIQKQNQEYQEQQTKNAELLIKSIVDGVVNHVPSHEENIKLTKITEEIDIILNQILQATSADRVSLVQYHNGGKGINKQAFLKMSMTNEQVRFGIKQFMPEFKDQFRSVLAYFVKELNDIGYCYISKAEDLKDTDNSMYDFMKNRGIVSKFGIALKDHKGAVIAFICIEYLSDTEIDLEKIDRVLKDKQKIVESLLSL